MSGSAAADHAGGRFWTHDGNSNMADNPPVQTFKGASADARVHHKFTFNQDSQKAGKMFDSYRPATNGGYKSRRSRSPNIRDGTKRHRDRSRDQGREWNTDRDRGWNRDRKEDGGRRGSFQPRPKFQPIPAHERPILLVSREKTPDQFPGMIHDSCEPVDENVQDNLQKGSDAESVAMDMDSEDENRQPKSHTTDDIKEGQEIMKAEQKKLDVIEMIRKTKVKQIAVAPSAVRNEVAANDDFISFGFSDDEKSVKEEMDTRSNLGRDWKKRRTEDYHRVKQTEEPAEIDMLQQDSQAPTAAFSHRDSFYRYLEEKFPPRPKDNGPPGVPAGHISAAMLPPPPGLPQKPSFASVGTPGGIRFSLPPKPVTGARAYHSGPDITAQDAISVSSSPAGSPRGSQHAHFPHGEKRKHEEYSPPKVTIAGILSSEWAWKRGSSLSPYPWRSSGLDHSKTLNMSDWLHQEIIDVVSYLSPRCYEHSVRSYIINEIRRVIRREYRDIDVRVFGSFATELYLPTADLDLAVISRSMATTGVASVNSKKKMRHIANLLKKSGIAKGAVTVIAKARVPIIKFVERKTGLNVDISFDNLSGITAIKTFQDWRKEFKALHPLAVIIKHFLDMRTLNVVYNGGLGGFSVSCMIVSMLQLHPSVASGNLRMEQNLGVGLLEFLKLYGHDFETEFVGIDVGRRAYFKKSPFIEKNRSNAQDRYLLHIVDPNDSSNNVAKSSFLIQQVLKSFGQAYDALVKRMEELHFMTFEERRKRGNTILGILLGGDYSVVEKQRKTMRQVYREVFREDPDEEERLLHFDDNEQDTATSTQEWFVDKGASEVYRAGLVASANKGPSNSNSNRRKERSKRKKEVPKQKEEKGKGTNSKPNTNVDNTSNSANSANSAPQNPPSSVIAPLPVLSLSPGSYDPSSLGPPPWTRRGEDELFLKPDVQSALQSRGLELGNGPRGTLAVPDRKLLKPVLKELGYYEGFKRRKKEMEKEKAINSRKTKPSKKAMKKQQAKKVKIGEVGLAVEMGGIGSRTRSMKKKASEAEKEVIVIDD